jgi:hypothetical protein
VEVSAGVDSSRQIGDEVVAEHMRGHRLEVHRLLPYRLCSMDICEAGCDPAVRAVGDRVAEAVEESASTLWEGAISSGRGAAPEIASLIAVSVGGDLQRTYCGAVHVGVRDVAFASPDGTDMRPSLMRTVREVVDNGSSRSS